MRTSSIIRRLAPLAIAAVASVATVACSGADDIGSSSANQRDTFNNPTEHGELQFGGANSGEFTADNRYHSWTFTLTDSASVELLTELNAQNLDTHLFLYKKGDEGWGGNIDNNDDYDGTLASRVAGRLGAGEYRVKVKATKQQMTGHFSLQASCSGAGCPVPDSGSCAGPDTMPTATGYTQACADILQAIVTTTRGAGPSPCTAQLADRAVAYYKQYWGDVGYWEEMSEDGEYQPDVSVDYHPGAGAVAAVGMGGDEDSMNFVFDTEGKLVFYYQHNQSPDWAWFCEGESAPEPDGECVSATIGNAEYNVEDVDQSSGSATAGQTDGLSAQVAAAVSEYAAAEGVGSSAAISYAAAEWNSNYVDGADVTLSAEGKPEVSYVVVGDPQWGMTIALRSDANGTQFVCKEM